MYKILLVDDERIVLESLKGSLDWEGLGFTICGTAESGAEALERIRELAPDVVFTDIRMPGLSGLELIKKAREIRDCSFVIVSGFAEFSYAQKAIKFGIEGYCLKPFDEDEIIAILQGIKERRSRSADNADLVWNLMEKQSDEKMHILRHRLHVLGLPEAEGYSVCMLRSATSVNLARFRMPAIHAAIGRAKYAVVTSGRFHEELQEWAEGALAAGIAISIGIDSCSTIADVHLTLERANIAAFQYFIDPSAGVYVYAHPDIMAIDAYINKLKDAIDKPELEAARKLIDEAQQILMNNKATIQSVLRMYYLVAISIEPELLHTDPYLYGFEDLIKQHRSFPELADRLKRIISTLSSPAASSVHPTVDHATLQNILDDVNSEFMNPDLSLRDLSGRYFLHPNYLSQLFKKHLGESFTDYLTGKRIAYACNMLSNTDLSIKAVGERCGYSDYFHFAKIFKKATGFTPSAYREHQHE